MSSSRKCAGRLFQTRGPATAKLLSPNVLYVRGTAHDQSVDERSRRLGPEWLPVETFVTRENTEYLVHLL